MTWDPYRQQPPQYPPQQPQSQPPQWQPERYDERAHYERATFQRPPQPGWQQPPQFPPPGPGHRQPPRKRRTGKIVAGIIGGFFLLIIVIAVAANSGKSPAPAASSSGTPAAGAPASSPAAKAAAAAAQTVTYVVTGSPADVTYGPAGSSLSGHSGMSKTVKLGNPAYYSIDAQLHDGGGSVTCEIKVNGKVISQAKASGSFNIASCEASKDPFSGQWADTNAA